MSRKALSVSVGALTVGLCMAACGPGATEATSPTPSPTATSGTPLDTSTPSPSAGPTPPPLAAPSASVPELTVPVAPVTTQAPAPVAVDLGRDSFGDPYITDAEGSAIHTGMSAEAAFAALGGQSSSGSTGQQAGPVLGYDYPVKGTGNPDDVMNDTSIWWQICVGYGRVVSTQRAKMDELAGRCPDPGS